VIELQAGDLTEGESALVSAVEAGTAVDLCTGDAQRDDPSGGAEWGADRTIRAEIIYQLVTGTAAGGRPRRLVLAGARIAGALNLEAAEVKCPMSLRGCFFEESISLTEARAHSIRLLGCHFAALNARQLETRGDLDLGECVAQVISLAGAHIGGQVTLDGAICETDDGWAVYADGLVVDQDVFIRNGFVARGGLRLVGAHVGGQLGCDGATLEARDGETLALAADGLVVEQGMFCRNGFTARGGVRLAGAHVGGQLSLNGSTFDGDGDWALSADGLVVDHDFLCQDGFAARGGVRLLGARIGGQVGFNGATLENESSWALAADRLSVDHSMFCGEGFEARGGVRLTGANVGSQLIFDGSTLHNAQGWALSADGLTVGGDLFCQEGFVARGGVRLIGAHVGGQLGLEAARIEAGETPWALCANGLVVDEDMFCRDGFSAQGAVGLAGAQIGGQLGLDGATLENENGWALAAERIGVGQGMFCRNGFTARGGVRLSGAHVEGQLGFTGATLESATGWALSADGLTVDQDLYCHHDFVARGGVRMLGARIGGQLSFKGATLSNDREWALSADGVIVGEGVFCDGLTAEGGICLAAASLGSQLSFNGATLVNTRGPTLNMYETAVKGSLWLGFGSAPEGEVNLTRARVGAIYDHEDRWPAALRLRGCTYDDLRAAPEVDVAGRLRWLRLDPDGYTPQPYEQLAAFYRKTGHDDAARRVTIAKERRRRGELSLRGKAWSLFLGAVVGHGYRTSIAAAWLVLFVLVGTVVFGAAHPDHFTEVRPVDDVPAFSSFVYALDSVVPIVDLHQRRNWVADGAAQWVSLFLMAAGWVLTTAVVLAITGVLRKD
jgi:hypothetical protein